MQIVVDSPYVQVILITVLGFLLAVFIDKVAELIKEHVSHQRFERDFVRDFSRLSLIDDVALLCEYIEEDVAEGMELHFKYQEALARVMAWTSGHDLDLVYSDVMEKELGEELNPSG